MKFGGHPMAAGFTLTEENIPSFIAALEEYAAEHYPAYAKALRNPEQRTDIEYRAQIVGDKRYLLCLVTDSHGDFALLPHFCAKPPLENKKRNKK